MGGGGEELRRRFASSKGDRVGMGQEQRRWDKDEKEYLRKQLHTGL